MEIGIHDGRKIREPKKSFRVRLFWQNNKKKIIKFIIFVIILLIIFCPIFTGGIIGHWIKDFFGTIINIIKTI